MCDQTLFRVVVDGAAGHAVCNAEVVFERMDGRWQISGACSGVFVLQGDSLPHPFLTTTKPDGGEDGVDYRTFKLLKASASSILNSGWTHASLEESLVTGLAVLRPCKQMEVEAAGVWHDRASGLLMGTPVGFSELWEEVGDVYMAILCTSQVDASEDAHMAIPCTSQVDASKDAHMVLACKAVDACVGSEHGMAALMGEAFARFCIANAVRSVRHIPFGFRPFVHACFGALQDLTPDLGEVERARQAKAALMADIPLTTL